MRIADLYQRGGLVFSFEFFPPKTEKGVRNLFGVLDELRSLDPDFISVTYPIDRDRRPLTVDLVSRVKRELGIEAMAHLTCVDASRDEMRHVLERLIENGIENVLALRGDAPPDDQTHIPREEWFPHANDLAAFIRESDMPLCIGGAAHPEVHPEAESAESDLRYLKVKVDAGCEFFITQLYFNNADYFDFVDRARNLGVQVPIVPGIMPVSSVRGIKRMCALNGSTIPSDYLRQLEATDGNDDAVAALGIEFAQSQCEELLDKGAPGIHFYTLNRSSATREILTSLRKR